MGKQVGIAGSMSFGWNENVLALRVQPLKLRNFLSSTGERKREAHFLPALNIAPP
jgi:hypothetical protein